MDKKKLRNDIILIGSLLVAAAVALTIIFTLPKPTKLVARVYVQDKVVETIDLSKKEDRDYVITGLNGKLKVHTHDGAVAIIESNCPHQDCVHMGYVRETGRPIICAYNGVYVKVEGGSSYYDVEI